MLNRTALILLSFSLFAAGQNAPQASAAKGTHKSAPQAILHTTAGDMKCQLFPDKAPRTVANFIGLAAGTKDWKDPTTGRTVHGTPLYDGVIFHRVIPNFMIQTGDPSGSGSGDVGFEFPDELHADLLYDKPGRMGMANHGINTNSSQFFITEVPFPSLNPCFDQGGCMGGRRLQNSGYTIFGQCDAATVELVKKIARMPCTNGPVCTDYNSRPQTPVKINHIEIVDAPGAPDKAAAVPKPTSHK